MDEFLLINQYFMPLTRDYAGAANLANDVAWLKARSDDVSVIVNQDSLVEGVHFLPDDPLDKVARKLLRVNISDIVAKGGVPREYWLALFWPENRDTRLIGEFARGLAQDQAHYGVHLAGGDSVVTPGPLCLSMTMIGDVSSPQGPVSRAGARIGDLLFVTGTIGDAAIGLELLKAPQGAAATRISAPAHEHLTQAYQLPDPPQALAPYLREWSHASIDISDGLLQDAGHIAKQSRVAIVIAAPNVPLSRAADEWIALQPDRNAALLRLISAGDDYQTLFCAPANLAPMIEEVARRLAIRVTQIGEVGEGAEVQLVDERGGVIPVERRGYSHF